MSPKTKRKTGKRHHWTSRETRVYLKYLQENEELFVDFKSRKSNKVFLNISKILKSRNANQVKSHHQKMVTKCGSIPSIIFLLRELQAVFDDSPSTGFDSESIFGQAIESPQPLWDVEPLDLGSHEATRSVNKEKDLD